MLNWIAQNTLAACGIALLATVVSLVLRRKPAAGHLLWLCVMVALVAPPLPKLDMFDGRAHARRLAQNVGTGWIELRTAANWIQPDSTTRTSASPEEPCDICDALPASKPNPAAETGLGLASLDQSDSTPPPALHSESHQPDPIATAKLAPASKAAQAEPAQAEYADAVAKKAESKQDSAEWKAAGWKPKPRPFDWAGLAGTLALAAWLIGSAIAAVRLALGVRDLRRLVAATVPATPEFADEVSAAARSLGIAPPRVRVSSLIKSPFIAGGLRPTLIWPKGQGLNDPGVRAVLAHELAHLARHDHWSAWFQAIAGCLLWWHPLAHLARGQTHRLAERACDAWVVWAYPNSRRDYADALLAAVERLTILPRPVPILGAVDSDRKTLARRLIMIMNGNVARRGSRILAISAITLTAALAPTWATAARVESVVSSFMPGEIDRSLQPLVDAAKLDRLAGSHANAEEWDNAIKAYKQLLALQPQDTGAWHDMAMAMYESGAYQDAAAAFHKGGAVAAKNGTSWFKTGGMNNKKAKEAAVAAKKAAKAATADAKEAVKAAKAMAAEHVAKSDEYRAIAADKAAHAAVQASKQIAKAKPQLEALRAKLAADGIKADWDADQVAEWKAEVADAFESIQEGEWSAEITDAIESINEHEWEADLADLVEVSMDGMDFDFDPDFDFDFDFEPDFDFDFDFGSSSSLADWAYNEACCLALAGDTDDALDALDRALAIGYDDADHARSDSDLDSLHGVSRFDDITARMGDLADLIELADDAFDEESWNGAAKAFTAATRLSPDNGHLHHMAAFAALRSGDIDFAADGWARALKLGYNKPTMLYNLACANAMNGQESDALDYLQQSITAGFSDYKLIGEDTDLDAIRDRSRFDDIVGQVVATAKLQREIETAEEFDEWSTVAGKARTIIDSTPKGSWQHSSAQDKLATALFYSGEYRQAEAAFRDLALANNTLENQLYNIACCRAQAGDNAGAIDYLHAAVDAGWDDAEHMQKDQDLASLHNESGFAAVTALAADREILGQFGAANWDQLATRSASQIDEDAEDGGAHMRLGWALLRTDRADQAIKVFYRQAEIGFAPGIALYNVACCQAVLGNTDAAFDAIEEAVGAGFDQVEFMAEDPDLKSLHADARFTKLIKAHAEQADAKDRADHKHDEDALAAEPNRERNHD